jgi:hypothetical protein
MSVAAEYKDRNRSTSEGDLNASSARMISHLPTIWLLSHAASTLAVTFNVPASPPANASKQLSAAPVGVSYVSHSAKREQYF